MIQDILPYKFNNQYDSTAVAKAGDVALAIQGSKLLMKIGEPIFPTVSQFDNQCEYVYLFSISDTRYFWSKGMSNIPDGYEYRDLREIRALAADYKHIVFAAYTAKHLSDWYNDNVCCGRCGHIMTHSKKERALECSCGYRVYPRIMPAVIVGVTNGDKLLITRYRNGYAHNALVAGFTEIGETAEETVAREVMEEAGLKVKNIRYYKSQPWGSANDLLLGFYCDVDGDATIHIDEDELKYAEWTSREDIVLQPDDISLTNEMMKMFKGDMI